METMQIIFRFPTLLVVVDFSGSFESAFRVVGSSNWAEKSSPKLCFISGKSLKFLVVEL